MTVGIIKKFLMICIVFFLCSSLAGIACADSLVPTIFVSSANATPGEHLSVSVELRNNPGVAAVCLDVAFDESILTLESVRYGDLYRNGGEANSSTGSPVRLSWSDLSEITGNTTFATLTFVATNSVTDGTSTDITVSYTEGNICNMNEDSLLFDCVNGQISFGNHTSSPSYDVNGDGKLSAADLISLAWVISEDNDSTNIMKHDLNEDGFVNLLDLVYLMKRLSSSD